ncbi:prepilin-type N-terminal cleavage/methylation domain-containing protein [Curtobacterium sp. MCSS17_016]|uniref:type II secretion system protein n=1 Tax=Curtobacterium sp. MCSS17_016 TaxID=2175644 RepID=UPI0024DF99A8|nr:prepilin-type N-terminal cleavage/methylation domain-containing protein [Curtobacterium sp. MCSS17_016]WIE78783.1 prepilin-type N-terminal cleavage/methylation domain-containing protein [Curtobacterium sp. MCSS17_016]
MYFALMGQLDARRKGLLKDGEKGFTLIELLVVVIIIGILAAIAIPVYIGVQNNAKDSAVKSDVTNAKTAVVSIATSGTGAFPDTADLTTTDYKNAGATKSSNTTAITYKKTTDGFCIQGTSSTSKTFVANETDGVKAGTC